MKKILLFLAMFILLASTVSAEGSFSESILNKDAKKVALFIGIDKQWAAKPKEMQDYIHQGTKDKLTPYNVYLMPIDQTQKILRSYIRENNLVENAREADQGVNLRKQDFQKLAEESGADYVMYVATRFTAGETKRNFWSGQRNQGTVICDVLLIKKDGTQYIIDESFSDTGSSSGSWQRVFTRALKKAFAELEIPEKAFD
jgi:hypothetical protein